MTQRTLRCTPNASRKSHSSNTWSSGGVHAHRVRTAVLICQHGRAITRSTDGKLTREGIDLRGEILRPEVGEELGVDDLQTSVEQLEACQTDIQTGGMIDEP